ncbi:aminoglycoside phosphotransferase family protein [Gordonia rubripertincta]|uniref:aminoglycoside phosphotransferase family protein n=1 Tax=Gordonia rubripertincta TaxID=36822 RepID=UPI0013C37296|nr:aminoglycoside phosphotransferase family protein [Gordonia rubripertincta]
MTSALRNKVPNGVAVESFTYSPLTSGTNVRGQMSVRYSSSDSGLPTSMFVKSTPTILTRLANSVTMAEEAAFYNDFRPRLGQLEIPHGYHSAVDSKTLGSIHLIEDLVDTKGATFPADPSTVLTRRQAEDAVDLLADVHRTFTGHRTDALPTFTDFWRRALGIADVAKAVRAFQGDDFCPPDLKVAGDRLWQACVRAIELHDELPVTLLHNDPHRGNWYVTCEGRMGLLDWQTVMYRTLVTGSRLRDTHVVDGAPTTRLGTRPGAPLPPTGGAVGVAGRSVAQVPATTGRRAAVLGSHPPATTRFSRDAATGPGCRADDSNHRDGRPRNAGRAALAGQRTL